MSNEPKPRWGARIAAAAMSLALAASICAAPAATAFAANGLMNNTVTQTVTCKKHSYQWIDTKMPTCTKTGTSAYKCTKCGKTTKTKTLKKTKHDYDWEIVTPATCTSYGKMGYKCYICGKVNKTKKIAKKAHTYSWETTAAATCTKDGTKQCKCTWCGKSSGKKQKIKALGHDVSGADYVNASYHKGTCYRCNKDVKTKHTMRYEWISAKQHAYCCTECEYKTKKASHKFGSNGLCTVCKQGKDGSSGGVTWV